MERPDSEQRNILLTLRFDGTAYHGWQVQRNAVTVQQTLQDALETVLGSRPAVIGCSRTDAGVHASEYCCNLHTQNAIPCGGLMRALNGCLPMDIAVSGCREVPEKFHARYSAAAKEYVYRIYRGPRDPFLHRYAMHYPYPIDIEAMRHAAEGFMGVHDFSAFCAAHGGTEDHIRNVTDFSLEDDGKLLLLRIRADGFLYNMVRIITGTLLAVSQGRTDKDEIPKILCSHDRTQAGPTAPAKGLTLNRIFYRPEAME